MPFETALGVQVGSPHEYKLLQNGRKITELSQFGSFKATEKTLGSIGKSDVRE